MSTHWVAIVALWSFGLGAALGVAVVDAQIHERVEAAIVAHGCPREAEK